MTNTESLGQRLKQWRLAYGLTVEDVAQRLECLPVAVTNVERGMTVAPLFTRDIEALINPDHDAIIDGVTAAVRGALASGCTVVRIVRPETSERGRLTVIIGDDEDEDWRRVL